MRKIKKKRKKTMENIEDEIDEGNSLNADREQDSDISFMVALTKKLTQVKLKKTGLKSNAASKLTRE